MKEIWKSIKNYEGLYEVSNLGRVKSLNYNKTGKEQILKPAKVKNGYLLVGLCNNKKVKTYHVHRLVAQTFIPNPNDLPQVNHKDEDKENNCIDNLEWCSAEYNMNYGTRNKRIGKANKNKTISEETRKKISNANNGKHCGKNNAMYGKHHSEESKRKMSEAHKGKYHTEEAKRKIGEAGRIPIYCVELDKVFDSIKQASEELGLYATSITAVCRGRQKTCGGYHFKYVD